MASDRVGSWSQRDSAFISTLDSKLAQLAEANKTYRVPAYRKSMESILQGRLRRCLSPHPQMAVPLPDPAPGYLHHYLNLEKKNMQSPPVSNPSLT